MCRGHHLCMFLILDQMRLHLPDVRLRAEHEPQSAASQRSAHSRLYISAARRACPAACICCSSRYRILQYPSQKDSSYIAMPIGYCPQHISSLSSTLDSTLFIRSKYPCESESSSVFHSSIYCRNDHMSRHMDSYIVFLHFQ